ncbi:MAG: YcaO-like family protein [Kiritimatiellia bacterium]|jgi:ribosomal protein S12 methylthiotransferase accessory factor|nr:YcaO-like family protein [Kiritimatiellia bacterium]MDP6848998.1 YcaO-like family protein [Kiritimatiellia bacterium]
MGITLSSAPRVANGRCAKPEETLERLESVLGAAYRFSYREEKIADSLYRGAVVTDALGFPPMGKGTTPLLCRISALAEAVEWLALKRRRELPEHIDAHQDEINAPLAIEELLTHIATVTPETAARIKQTEAARHWVSGYSLVEERPMNVPLEYIHGISGTNGLAAGNCIEEAIVQGTNEVLERRAVITLVKNRMTAPTFDINSVESTVARDQISCIRDHGIDVTIKDLSFGGALPCLGVYFRDRRIPPELQCHHLFKAAASCDRTAALVSCLTEYAQLTRLTRNEGPSSSEHERLLCEEDSDNFLPLFWFGYIPFPQADFLEQGEVIPFDPGELPDDCLEDIARAKEIFRQLGKDYLVVDLTDPKVDFPVVQVVIPGYSDILPYHPASSPVLFSGWTRELSMGRCSNEAGPPTPCTAQGLFPEW